MPGVDHAVAISGISALDNNASLQNAGAVYVVLKDWSQRGAGTGADLRSLYVALQSTLDDIPVATCVLLIPPPIQGIGNASGFTMQVELRDGNFDYAKLERLTRSIVADGGTQSALRR
jgi:HAE1 family hydrophobic/amphiphilic exporter-1